ncbi:hypothetical protein ADT26_19775 [Xanthomonas oryzae]|nr:hypothetical protein ADT26_19775 [Xanthomonas oryzae]
MLLPRFRPRRVFTISLLVVNIIREVVRTYLSAFLGMITQLQAFSIIRMLQSLHVLLTLVLLQEIGA